MARVPWRQSRNGFPCCHCPSDRDIAREGELDIDHWQLGTIWCTSQRLSWWQRGWLKAIRLFISPPRRLLWSGMLTLSRIPLAAAMGRELPLRDPLASGSFGGHSGRAWPSGVLVLASAPARMQGHRRVERLFGRAPPPLLEEVLARVPLPPRPRRRPPPGSKVSYLTPLAA